MCTRDDQNYNYTKHTILAIKYRKYNRVSFLTGIQQRSCGYRLVIKIKKKN